MKNTIYLLVLVLALFSCSKDDDLARVTNDTPITVEDNRELQISMFTEHNIEIYLEMYTSINKELVDTHIDMFSSNTIDTTYTIPEEVGYIKFLVFTDAELDESRTRLQFAINKNDTVMYQDVVDILQEYTFSADLY